MKRILVLSNVKGKFYLKTSEEINEKTAQNANACGYSVVSRKSKGIVESLTERAYSSAEEARDAAKNASCIAISYQKLARLGKASLGEVEG
jgi:hypothetical protein